MKEGLQRLSAALREDHYSAERGSRRCFTLCVFVCALFSLSCDANGWKDIPIPQNSNNKNTLGSNFDSVWCCAVTALQVPSPVSLQDNSAVQLKIQNKCFYFFCFVCFHITVWGVVHDTTWYFLCYMLAHWASTSANHLLKVEKTIQMDKHTIKKQCLF